MYHPNDTVLELSSHVRCMQFENDQLTNNSRPSFVNLCRLTAWSSKWKMPTIDPKQQNLCSLRVMLISSWSDNWLMRPRYFISHIINWGWKWIKALVTVPNYFKPYVVTIHLCSCETKEFWLLLWISVPGIGSWWGPLFTNDMIDRHQYMYCLSKLTYLAHNCRPIEVS